MNKPRLIKKDAIPADAHPLTRRGKKNKKKPTQSAATQAFKATTEWIQKRSERPSAREAFAALFVEPESQSA